MDVPEAGAGAIGWPGFVEGLAVTGASVDGEDGAERLLRLGVPSVDLVRPSWTVTLGVDLAGWSVVGLAGADVAGIFGGMAAVGGRD